MAEQPKPPADLRLPPTAEQGDGRGASHAAFDAWLRDALRQRFGGVANEPIPDELRRLAAGGSAARRGARRRLVPPV
jgi:hypothetical protein